MQYIHNQRTTGVGRFWRLFSPSPSIKWAHIEQVAQDHIQVGFKNLQRRKFHNFNQQPFPGLASVNNFFLIVRWNFLCFSCAPCTVTGHQWKETDSNPSTPILKIFLGIYKIPLVPLFSRLSRPCSFSLISWEKCSSLLLFIALHWTLFGTSLPFMYWGAQTWTQWSTCSLIRDE